MSLHEAKVSAATDTDYAAAEVAHGVSERVDASKEVILDVRQHLAVASAA